MGLEITLLGPPRVERDGRPIAFDTRKATALLAHLALADRPRSREALAELLWPDRGPEHARGALRRTLSTLRTAIGEEWLETSAGRVALSRAKDLEIDVERFRALSEDGGAEAALAEAVELSRGEFMEGFALRDSAEFDHWQAGEADALRRELAGVLGRLVELLAARGAFPRAVALTRRWLALDPLHEPAHRALIRLLAWSGDRAAALDAYRECVRALSRELGVAPLPDTTALYERVNEGTLDRPSRDADGMATPAFRIAQPADRARGGVGDAPLVGRVEELRALTESYEGIAADGRLAVIEGEAGIGKTRLATEFLEAAGARGAAVLSARCHEGEARIAYGPVAELLRAASEREPDPAGGAHWSESVSSGRLADVARLAPGVEQLGRPLERERPLDGLGAQARLLESVAEVLVAACRAPVPGVVFVDDVHGADAATLDAILYLARRLRDRPLLMLLAWRGEEVPPEHRLRQLTSDASGPARATSVRLGRLSPAEVTELVRAAEPASSGDFSRRVVADSEGLPLLAVEYLAAVRGSGDVDELALPRGASDVFRARLAPLAEGARQVIGAGAVIGRVFDFDTLREASGRSEEETVEALEALTAHGLIEEAGPDARYSFSHGKMRTLVLGETSFARRRLLHRRVADALRSARPAPDSAVVAHHLRHGGRELEAAEHYALAAERAGTLHAHAAALEHLEAALALGHPQPASLHERTGDHRTALGDYAGALAAYEAAGAACASEDLARVEQKVSGVLHRRGEWERAEARLVAAWQATAEDDLAAKARIQADRSLTVHRAGREEEAAVLARDARELAREAGDVRALAQAHNMLGVLAHSDGDLTVARDELERSIVLAGELEDAEARAAGLNNLALANAAAGDLDRALELTREALELCTAYGDRHQEAALRNNYADLLHAADRGEESMAELKRAVSIFSAIDADETTRQPEVWKLVSW